MTRHDSCCHGIFFFSSRRRHTRCGRDWSSDVCSSDLTYTVGAKHSMLGVSLQTVQAHGLTSEEVAREMAVRSEERRVGKSVDLGGRRVIKKKTYKSRQRGE